MYQGGFELIMERTTFLEHYRICNQYDGSGIELGRIGPAVIYKASDLRSDTPVALTLLPITSVDPAARDRFEEQARAAQQLDHINIAKTVAFGAADDQFALVSEYPHGDTLETWISAHGPLPPDAVLRVALQVVSALAAASFNGLTHSAIQPANLLIVTGRTAEGGWPYVKLLDFGLAGLKLSPTQQPEAMASEFASPEQLERGTVDFRSEIYSLGATMCFLLTGAFYSAEPRSLQTRRFARPLRKLITPMLRQNPDERPQDPLLFGQALRSCLQRIERRQLLAQRLGIPFIAVKAKTPRRRPTPVPIPFVEPEVISTPSSITAARIPQAVAAARVAPSYRPWFWQGVAIAAILLALATAAAVLLPAPVSLILHHSRDKAAIGIPVGVPEASPASIVQNAGPSVSAAPTTTALPSSATASVQASGSSANQAVTGPSPNIAAQTQAVSPVPPQSVAPMIQSSPAASTQVASAGPVASPPGQTQNASTTTDAPAPAEGPQTAEEREAEASPQPSIGNADNDRQVATSAASEDSGRKPSSESGTASSKSRSKPKSVASNTRRTTTRRYEGARRTEDPSDEQDQFRPPHQPYSRDEAARPRRAVPENSFRARVVGTTPEGDLILRLPSGEIAIAPSHRRPRRIYIERQPYFVPQPRPEFVPAIPPDA